MTRIPYPDLEGLPRLAREAMATLPAPLNLVTMSAHSPMLVAPLVSLGTTILARLAMTPRDREILVLVTAAEARCAYVLAQHRTMAAQLGLTDPEIEALCRVPADLEAFDNADRLIIKAAQQLLDTTTIDEDTLAHLQRRWNNAEIVEFFFVIGHYRMISGLLNGLNVEIDPSGKAYARLSEQNLKAPRREEVSR